MQSGLQGHQNLLHQITSFGASQGQSLDTLREELNRAVRSRPNLENPQPVDPSPESISTQNPTNSTEFGTNTYQPQTVALHLCVGRHKGCKCSCHRQNHLWSPSFLDHVFGSLFVGYVGIPKFSTKCTFKGPCCQGAETKMSVAYVFPLWLVALIIIAKIEHSQRRGPQMLIRCLRVRPKSSQPFQAAYQNQWSQLKMLIMNEKASPLDVQEEGNSLLHVSGSNRLHMCFRDYST